MTKTVKPEPEQKARRDQQRDEGTDGSTDRERDRAADDEQRRSRD